MLGKLIKYEWKACYKVLAALNLTLVLITVIGCLILQAIPSTEENIFFLAVLFIMLSALSISAFNLTTQIYIYFRFYKNLFTAEGYLMHTLPVTPLQLFHSKLIVGYFWFIVNTLLSFFCLAVLGWASRIFRLENTRTELQFLFQYTIGGSPGKFILLLLTATLASGFSSILMGYLSILLGQLVEKYKLGAAIGFYIALYLVSQVLSSLLMIIPTTFMAVADDMGFYGEFASCFYGNLLLWLIAAWVLFGCAYYAACVFIRRNCCV